MSDNSVQKKCARPSCRNTIVGKPVSCLKEGCNISWCSSRCRTNDFRKHQCVTKGIDVMTHIKRKNQYMDSLNNRNVNVNVNVNHIPDTININNNDDKTPVIEAANMLLDSNLYCKLCHKELAIITCCTHNHYCSHSCRYKDWPLHKDGCQNEYPSIGLTDEGKLKMYCRYLTSKFYSDRKIFEVFAHETDEYVKRKHGPFYLCKVVSKSEGNIQSSNDYNFLDISMDRFGSDQEEELSEKVRSKLGMDMDLSDCLFFIFCIGTSYCHTILIKTSDVFRYIGNDKAVPHSLIPSFLEVESIDPCRFVDRIYTMDVMKYYKVFSIEDVTNGKSEQAEDTNMVMEE